MVQTEKKEQEESVIASFSKDEKSRQALEVAEEARQEEYLYPSFGAQLFLGTFASDLLSPFPIQSADEKKIGDEYIAKIKDYLGKSLDPEEVDATRTIPPEVIKTLGEMGAFAMKVPKEYGGLGFSQTNYNRVIATIGSFCGGTAVLLSAHQSIGVPQPLKMFGTEEQKRKFFPRFRQGAISAFALTEPGVGSDPAEMSAEAKLSSDGKYYILNGIKLWCTNGSLANIIVITAKTTPKIVRGKEKKQITAFILEMNTPGIEIMHRCEFMGLGGIYNAMIRFTNVQIPVENRLSEEGRGLAIALATINVGRLTLPAASLGAAKQLLKIARKWGSERIQWGQPIGLHEAGREKEAYIASHTLAIEAITWLTSGWQDRGGVDIRIEAAMAKLFCSEVLWKMVDETMQLRGGRGYEKARSLKARGEPAYPVERVMRDCRINLILEGSSEIMRLFLAREAMDPHLKRIGELLSQKRSMGQKIFSAFKSLGYYSLWYTKQLFAPLFIFSHGDKGKLKEHYRFIERNSHKLARKFFEKMIIHRDKLEKKQHILGRLVDVGTNLFAMSAVCAYAHHLEEKKEEEGSAIELADYFCIQAQRQIKNSFKLLSDNDDRESNLIAKDVIAGRFHWLERDVMPLE